MAASITSTQQHHGGSLWVLDDDGWFLLRNQVGIEWSLQFLCLPERVDLLRQNAQRLYRAFPKTIPALVSFGIKDAADILGTPITTPELVGRWVDSIFNSCVPLAAGVHVGVLSAKNPLGGGWHHYPEPVVAGQFLKDPTYVYWVIDSEGKPAAVSPVAPKGSGNSNVKVEYATEGTALHDQHMAAHDAGKQLILPGSSDLAQQAFAKQGGS